MDDVDELPVEDKVMLPNGSTFDMASLRFNHDENLLIERGERAWKEKKQNANRSWEEWVEIGWALNTGRREIARRVNATTGKRFNPVMRIWLERRGFDDIDKGARSRLLKIMHMLPEISAWHAGLDIAERVRCNHPDTVLSHYNKFLNTGMEKPQERIRIEDVEIKTLQAEIVELGDLLKHVTVERDTLRKRAEQAEWELAAERTEKERTALELAQWKDVSARLQAAGDRLIALSEPRKCGRPRSAPPKSSVTSAA